MSLSLAGISLTEFKSNIECTVLSWTQGIWPLSLYTTTSAALMYGLTVLSGWFKMVNHTDFWKILASDKLFEGGHYDLWYITGLLPTNNN